MTKNNVLMDVFKAPEISNVSEKSHGGIGFINNTRPTPPGNKLEVLAALDYAITPIFVFFIMVFAYYANIQMKEIQEQIIAAMLIATTIRGSLFVQRVNRRNNEGE